MRISDWSSDVCSSDLPPPPSLSAQPPSVLASQGRRGDGGRIASLPFGRHQRTEDTETMSMTLSTNAPGTRPRSAGILGTRGDRTSVAEGKSVSVRVDLGGRRVLKKKKEEKQST